MLLFSCVNFILHKIIAMEILIHEYLNIMNEASEKLWTEKKMCIANCKNNIKKTV